MPDPILRDADTALRHILDNSDQQPRRRRAASRLPVGFHSIAELAAIAGRARSGLYEEVRRGRLSAHQWRGRLVISEANFRAWLRPAPVPGPAAVVDNPVAKAANA